jgi:hypothetical protein
LYCKSRGIQFYQAPQACLYVAESGAWSITVSLISQEAVKLSLLNGIAQLRRTCSIAFEYSSLDPDPEPTPLPPDIQELLDRSLAELMALSEEAHINCGWGPPGSADLSIPSLGEATSYTVLDFGFVESATLSVVLGDNLLGVTYAGQELDHQLVLPWVEALAQEALLALR